VLAHVPRQRVPQLAAGVRQTREHLRAEGGMRKKPPQKKHHVKASLKVPGLTKAGTSLNLEIFADEQKLGEIILGRGSLYWCGKNRHSSKRINWTRFAEVMDDLAYGK
jgi:hypothetical protein